MHTIAKAVIPILEDITFLAYFFISSSFIIASVFLFFLIVGIVAYIQKIKEFFLRGAPFKSPTSEWYPTITCQFRVNANWTAWVDTIPVSLGLF